MDSPVFAPPARKLAAVWFADIVGYTRLSARDENAALEIVDRFQRASREVVERYGGRLVKFLGDGAMAAFSSTDAAARSAIALCRAVGATDERNAVCLLRIGVHVGNVVTASDGDIYGDGVNMASRLQEEAAPGQVIVSEDVWRHLRQQPEFAFRPVGERGLRGIQGRVRLFALDVKEAATPPRPLDHRSIAVLPFLDISPGRDNEYFSDGISEELINALSHVEGLHVASRTSSFAFKGKDLTIGEIAEKLGVTSVLEGSVRKDGNRLRITPQLIDAEKGYHVWSEMYESELDNIFEVQEKISRAIVESLQLTLRSAPEAPIVRPPTSDLEAYNRYLRGRFHWNRHTGEDLQRSLDCFEAAIVVDPHFALAHAGLADTYLTLGALSYLPPKQAYPKARAAAQRALEVDDKLAEAHAALAEVRMRFEWDWKAAEAGFQRALDLNPGYAQASRFYANYLRDMGRIDEAITVIRRAQSLDPLSLPIRVAVAGIYYFARRYDEAIEECLHVLEEAPYFFQALYYLGSSYEQKEMYDQAIEVFEKMVSMSGIPGLIGALGYVKARAGRRDEAEAVQAEIQRLSESRYVSPYILAMMHAGLGALDEAFECFDRAVAERSNWLTSLKVEPHVDPLRMDPRFVELLRKVGLAEETAAVPGDLQAPPTPLVGREREIQEIRDLLLHPGVRLVTLTGSGGTGKTRLGLEIAHVLRKEFVDGVFFVPLWTVRDADLVVSTIGRTLGIQESPSETPLATLTAHLSGKRLLLVLDSFEQVVDAAGDVAAILESAPNVHILVTSREPLRIRSEHEFPLGPLELPDPKVTDPESLRGCDAVELFVQRAQGVRPGFRLTTENAGAVADICRRLSGLPLALELAAARVKTMSPQLILKRLADRFAFLTEGPRDAPGRQQTLRRTFDWSYELLTEEEQILFRDVSVFVGGFTVEAAERVTRVANDIDFHVLDGLSGLVNKSLIRQTEVPEGEPRFEMLETTREYGLLMLQESGDGEVVRQRHAEYFLHLAEEAETQLDGPDQARWFESLEAEHNNVMRALDWLLSRGRVEAAVQMGSALWWFWWVRGHFREMRVRLEQALATSAELPTALRANLLVASGAMISLDGDHERAVKLFEEAVALERERRDKTGVPRALRSFGLMIATRGEYARAAALFNEALAHDRESGNMHGVSADLRALGKMELYQENHERAQALFEEAIDLDRERGDSHSAASSLSALGDVALANGHADRAIELYGEALALYRELGTRPGIAKALHDLAGAERHRGNFDAAAVLYGEALTLLEELGNKRRTADCLAGIAGLGVAGGQTDLAARLCGAVKMLRESLGLALPPAEWTRFESDQRAAVLALGDQGFEQEIETGRLLDAAGTVALAREILSRGPRAGWEKVEGRKSELRSSDL